MSHLPVVFERAIPGKVEHGTSITLEGKVNSGTSRFDIELKSNKLDIPVHASFRYSEGCVVRNSVARGSWGSEKRDGAMPLHTGQNFVIDFQINSYDIKMYVNGCHFCSFSPRTPMSSICGVAVYGGASISSLRFNSQQVSTFPSRNS